MIASMSMKLHQYTPCFDKDDVILRNVLLQYYDSIDSLVCFHQSIPQDMFYNHLRHGFNYSGHLNPIFNDHRIHVSYLIIF